MSYIVTPNNPIPDPFDNQKSPNLPASMGVAPSNPPRRTSEGSVQSMAVSEGGSLERITSTEQGTAGSKKRRNLGAFARIDAWWGAVRHSFHSSGPEESKAQRPPLTAVSAGFRSNGDMSPRTMFPPSAHLPTSYSVERGSPSDSNTSGAMLPPPLPVKRGRSSDSAQQATSRPAAGALAPAAKIKSNSLKPPSRERTTSADSGDSDTSQTKAGERRRNPQLSLNLDPRHNAFANQPPVQQSHAPSAKLPVQPAWLSTEASPALTPGSAPAWDRTPGPVPSTTATRLGTLVSASPIRPNLPRGTTENAPSFSMTSIQQQIKSRLSIAKEGCDRELRKITQGITVFVEHELERERSAFASMTAEAAKALPDELSKALAAEALAQDGGTESDATGHEGGDESDHSPYIRSRSSSAMLDQAYAPDTTSNNGHAVISAPASIAVSPTQSVVGLPVRRASIAHRGRIRNAGDVPSPRRPSQITKRYSAVGLAPRQSDQGLHRSPSAGPSNAASASSSRSTSRSRSPMPPVPAVPAHLQTSQSSGHASPTRHGSDSQGASPFVSTLQAIITVATEVLDTNVTNLIQRPGICTEFIARVQAIGRAWDDNADWPCRGYYVQLLLAVAALSRVVEWWEAEKGFWKFDDNDDGDDTEPIMFINKVAHEGSGGAARSRSNSSARHLDPAKTFLHASPLDIDLGDRPIMPATESQQRLSVTAPKPQDASQAQTDAQDLKTAVEEVRNATILMELSLQDELFHYLSPVWQDVVGCVRLAP